MKFPVTLTWRLLCCKLLEQWFSTRANIAPQGTVLAVTSGGGEMLQLLRGERPRMLLNILHCTGLSPTTKNYPVQTPLVLRLRSAAREPVQLSRAALCQPPGHSFVSYLAISIAFCVPYLSYSTTEFFTAGTKFCCFPLEPSSVLCMN